MTVKQCDRCGAICGKRAADPNIPEFNHMTLTVRLTNNKFTGKKISVDLCPDCQEDLWEWLTEKGLDPTKKGE